MFFTSFVPSAYWCSSVYWAETWVW